MIKVQLMLCVSQNFLREEYHAKGTIDAVCILKLFEKRV